MTGGAERCLSDNKTHHNSWNHFRLKCNIKGSRISSSEAMLSVEAESRSRCPVEETFSSATPPGQDPKFTEDARIGAGIQAL